MEERRRLHAIAALAGGLATFRPALAEAGFAILAELLARAAFAEAAFARRRAFAIPARRGGNLRQCFRLFQWQRIRLGGFQQAGHGAGDGGHVHVVTLGDLIQQGDGLGSARIVGEAQQLRLKLFYPHFLQGGR